MFILLCQREKGSGGAKCTIANAFEVGVRIVNTGTCKYIARHYLLTNLATSSSWVPCE